MSDVVSAVAGTVADLFGDQTDAAEPVTVPNSPEADAPDLAHEPATVLPDLNPDLPEDLADYLDAPDLDDDEPAAVWGDEPDDEGYVDPDQLARENAKLKKRLEYEQQQKLKVGQKAWAAEAKKIAPLATPDQIQATSRRAFLRQARAQHEERFALLKPHIESYEQAKQQLRAEVEAEVRAELAAAWGKPTVGAGATAPGLASAKQDDLTRARNSRNLAGVARALMNNNDL